MKPRRTLSAKRTIGVGVATVACLTGISAVPAGADAPVRYTDTVTFTDISPCSGEDHEITLNFDVSEHSHKNNFVVHVSRTGETSDGYVMRHGSESFVVNNNVLRGAFTDNWRHANGSKFKVQGVIVVDLATDEARVDRFRFRCLDKN